MTRCIVVGVIAAVVVLSAVAPVAAAAIAYDAEAPLQAQIATDVTISSFDRVTTSPGQYEGDNGDLKTLPATISDSNDVDDLDNGHVNEFSFTPTSDVTTAPNVEAIEAATNGSF